MSSISVADFGDSILCYIRDWVWSGARDLYPVIAEYPAAGMLSINPE
jgi:hypothetical protein